jgi:hypothetical protein
MTSREYIIANCNRNPRSLIDGFFGDYRWLSNFHLCDVKYEKDLYVSSENAFQAAKEIKEYRKRFFYCSPSEAKRMGRVVKLPENWNILRVLVMKDILFDKFNRNLDLKEKLIKTGDARLVEGNWWNDTYWGVCNGVGHNVLGNIIMEIRRDLISRIS